MMWKRSTLVTGVVLLAALSFASPAISDVKTIIEKSVQANKADFQAAPQFNYTERVRKPGSDRTSRVIMLDGSPYQKLIALRGKPLDAQARQQEEQKFEKERAKRRAESSEDRKNRIAKYEADRKRDNAMMEQLTKAFNFTLVGRRKVGRFEVYVLRAKPRPGYQPPNMQTQVLPSMQGMLWIDTRTYQWVKVTAEVIHPASIEGFLAQVEPGTRFELENMPVGNGIWQAKHFSMKSQAKVLFMFDKNSQEDDTFSDYEKVTQK